MRMLCLAVFAALVSVCAVHAQETLAFQKVDFFDAQGDGEKKRDARLELDPTNRILRIVDEKNGAQKALYLEVPYDSVTKIVYERSAPQAVQGRAAGESVAAFDKGQEALADNRI